MSTRSAIVERQPDGCYRGVYCHWDGYPSHNGRILLDNYKDAGAVSALIDLGDLSQLAETPAACVAYHRDRGEDLNITMHAELGGVLAQIDHRFAYVFADGAWRVGDEEFSNGEDLAVVLARGDS